MTATANPRTRQRFDALDRANHIRLERAQIKRELRNGTRLLADLLREPEWPVFSMPVCELLLLAPRVGRMKASYALRRAEVWPLREVGRLTIGQRERLVSQLADFGRR